jgi:hypothetical protein
MRALSRACARRPAGSAPPRLGQLPRLLGQAQPRPGVSPRGRRPAQRARDSRSRVCVRRARGKAGRRYRRAVERAQPWGRARELPPERPCRPRSRRALTVRGLRSSLNRCQPAPGLHLARCGVCRASRHLRPCRDCHGRHRIACDSPTRSRRRAGAAFPKRVRSPLVLVRPRASVRDALSRCPVPPWSGRPERRVAAWRGCAFRAARDQPAGRRRCWDAGARRCVSPPNRYRCQWERQPAPRPQLARWPARRGWAARHAA